MTDTQPELMDRRVEIPLLTRAAADTIDNQTRASINSEARTVEVIFSAGAEVRRTDWWSESTYMERLDLQPGAVRLDWLNSGSAPLLDSHEAWTLGAGLGVVVAGSASVDGAQGIATVQFPALGTKARADEVFALIEQGQISRVSVGYKVHLWEESRDGNGRLIARTAVDWEPIEISFVLIPADPLAGVRSEARVNACTIRTLMERSMSATDTSGGTGAAPAPVLETRAAPAPANTTQPLDIEAIVQRRVNESVSGAVAAALEKHKTESAEIRTIVRQAGLDDAFADQLVTRGIAPQYAGNHVLEELVKRNGNGVPAMSRARQGESHEDPAVMLKRMSAAISAKATDGLSAAHRIAMPDEARDYADLTMLEMGVMLLEARGHRVERVRNASERYEILQRAMSTSDFPQLLASAGNKILLAEHRAAAPTYQTVFAKKRFADFKPHRFLRSGDFPTLLEKGETADYKTGAMGESKNEVVLSEWGRVVSLSRRVLINDELAAFADLPQKAARRAAAFENATAWALLALNSGAGPTVYDPAINSGNGRPLFHADHGNLAGSGAAISVTTIGAARAAMMVQKSVGTTADPGVLMNIMPRFLVTAPGPFTLAEQFCAMPIVPTTDATTNPFKGRLTPVGDGNLTGTSYYLFADPMDAETLVYGYLDGTEGPRFETRTRFENDGLDFKIAEDFAVGVVDFRGAYKNPGA